MVITQTCDLVKPADQLHQVEVVRVVSTTNAVTIAQAQHFGSARYFRLNDPAEAEAVVLDYGHRALIEKGFLEAVEPDNSLIDAMPARRRLMLARWLGQRYSRPAIPDVDYEEITRPISNAWHDLVQNDSERARLLNQEYSELRYRREVDGSLSVFILSPKPNPDEVTALELIDVLETALADYPGEVRFPTDKRSYATFSKLDELDSEQIYLEWASQDEDDPDAALPSA
jgi:hypothetical protein